MEHDTPPPAEDGATTGSDVLEEQRARIAALRVAVLTGRVPEEGEFDYERFFAVKPEPREP